MSKNQLNFFALIYSCLQMYKKCGDELQNCLDNYLQTYILIYVGKGQGMMNVKISFDHNFTIVKFNNCDELIAIFGYLV